MAKDNQTLRLLIIEESQNDAEQLINVFRNAGLATRAHRTISAEALEEQLNAQEWDLLISSETTDELDAQQALNIVKQLKPELPILLLLPEPSAKQVSDALAQGFSDVVPYDEDKRLVIVAKRALAHLNTLRSLQQANISLSESEKRCQLLLDSSVDAITYVHEGMHIYANKAYAELFGYEDVEEMECMPIIDMVSSKDQRLFKDFFKRYQHNPSDNVFNCNGLRADDSEFSASLEASAATYDGEPCIQIVIRVNADSAELEEKLREASMQDSITGLYNRAYIAEKLGEISVCAAEKKASGALLYLCLDNFEQLRSKINIAQMDNFLAAVAAVLKPLVNEQDILARFGDDVFLSLCYEMPLDKAKALAKALSKALEGHMFDVEGLTLQTTGSVGIVMINEIDNQADKLMSFAERANQAACAKGGGSLHVHSSQDELAAQASQGDVSAILQQAMHDSSFEVLYQPLISLRGDEYEHYQTSLQLKDPQGELLNHEQVLELAQSTELSTKIDRWSILQAIKTLASHRIKNIKTRLFVQLSADSIKDETLPAWLNVALNAAELPSDSIIFELDEAHASTHLKGAKLLSEKLKSLNFELALSHYGKNPNPSNTLKHVQCSFVMLECSDASSADVQTRLKEDVAFLQSKGKLTVIPGIDSPSTLTVMYQMGVNFIRGEFFQGPSASMDYDFSDDM